MIDLRKVSLLEDFRRLPYSFVMPDVLFEDEWLCISDGEKISLRRRGLEVRELPGLRLQEHNDISTNTIG